MHPRFSDAKTWNNCLNNSAKLLSLPVCYRRRLSGGFQQESLSQWCAWWRGDSCRPAVSQAAERWGVGGGGGGGDWAEGAGGGGRTDKLRASLSGPFLQRMDVVNQRLEFGGLTVSTLDRVLWLNCHCDTETGRHTTWPSLAVLWLSNE